MTQTRPQTQTQPQAQPQTQPQTQTRPHSWPQQEKAQNPVTLKRNDLTVECFFNENGKLSRKVERYDRQSTQYAYQYDAKGHLTKALRDGTVTESYQYNQSGQRVEQTREYRGFSDASSGMLRYDSLSA